MKAVRIHEYGGPEKLQLDQDVPDPVCGDDMLLIEAAATSVNPIDWKIRSGVRQKDMPLTLPAILGRDVSGIVRSVGLNVRTFKPGERVLAQGTSTYAELVAVKGDIVTHLPDGLNLIDSAAIPLVILTGDQLVTVSARAERGQTFIISGALGSVGRAAVHSAKKRGVKVIAGVRKRQLAEAASLGVSGTLAIDDDDAIAKYPKVDGVIDTVGHETAAKLFARIRDGGSFAYASVLPEATPASNPAVRVARVLAQPDASKVREFADYIRDGKFVLPISQRLPLREAAKAHALMEKGGAGKIVLVIKESAR